MQEMLFDVAYDLLSAYVLPNKVYDVLEDLACQIAIEDSKASAEWRVLKVHAIKAAASALRQAQEKISEKYTAMIEASKPGKWTEEAV